MSAQANMKWYGNAFVKAFNKEIDWDSDNLKVLLVDSSYTPNPDTHVYRSDISGEASGTGYTAGGQALSSKTNTYIPAASVTTWAGNQAYALGDIRRPTVANGRIYRCVQAGTSGSTQPTWPTGTGERVTDGGVIWQEAGRGYIRLGAANVTWASSTITARRPIAYIDTGNPATSPLMGYGSDPGADQSSNNGNFTLTWGSGGIFNILVPY